MKKAPILLLLMSSLAYGELEPVCYYRALTADVSHKGTLVKRVIGKISERLKSADLKQALIEKDIKEIRNAGDFTHYAAALIKALPNADLLWTLRDGSEKFPLSAVHMEKIHKAIIKRWGKNAAARGSGDWGKAAEIAFQKPWGESQDVYFHHFAPISPVAKVFLDAIFNFQKEYRPKESFKKAAEAMGERLTPDVYMETTLHYIGNHQPYSKDLFSMRSISRSVDLSPNQVAHLHRAFTNYNNLWRSVRDPYNLLKHDPGMEGFDVVLFFLWTPTVQLTTLPMFATHYRIKKGIDTARWGKSGHSLEKLHATYGASEKELQKAKAKQDAQIEAELIEKQRKTQKEEEQALFREQAIARSKERKEKEALRKEQLTQSVRTSLKSIQSQSRQSKNPLNDD